MFKTFCLRSQKGHRGFWGPSYSPGVGLAPHPKKKPAFQNHDLKDFPFRLLGVDATTSCHANDFWSVLGVFWGGKLETNRNV